MTPDAGWGHGTSTLLGTEARFQAVTESIGDAVIVTDVRSEILFWNAGAETIFGYSEREALGSPLTMLMPERFRDAHHAGLARVLAGGETHVIGNTIRLAGLHRDGTEFPMELTLGQWSDDERTLFTGVVHDITERDASERYLAAQLAVTGALVEAASAEEAVPLLLPSLATAMGWQIAALWTVDEDGAHIRCEQYWRAEGVVAEAFEKRTREAVFSVGEGFPGHVWRAGEPLCVEDFGADERFPRAPLAASAGLRRAIGLPLLIGGETLAVIEFLTYEAGAPDAGLTAMMETLGRQLGLFFLRRRIEQSLAEARAELERSNADLEQFAYVASHDLSEPLRTVAGFVQLLGKRYEGQLDAQADEFIGYALDGVGRMRQLIDDLLLFSRAGAAELQPEPVPLGEAVDRVRSSLAANLEETGGRIEAGELPEVVADRTQVEQLLQNLISNGLKFHGEEPPRVGVSAVREGASWRVEVEDNGIGVDPQYADRIFKMFQRLHGRDAYAGTGIGLAVCKRIVERHGGRIWVESPPAGGTRFCFTLGDQEAAT